MHDFIALHDLHDLHDLHEMHDFIVLHDLHEMHGLHDTPKAAIMHIMHTLKTMQTMHIMHLPGCTHDLNCPARRAYKTKTLKDHSLRVLFSRSRHLPIFTGRVQPTIFGTSELNFCVRNGNRWDLTVIDTGRLSLALQFPVLLLLGRLSILF